MTQRVSSSIDPKVVSVLEWAGARLNTPAGQAALALAQHLRDHWSIGSIPPPSGEPTGLSFAMLLGCVVDLRHAIPADDDAIETLEDLDAVRRLRWGLAETERTFGLDRLQHGSTISIDPAEPVVEAERSSREIGSREDQAPKRYLTSWREILQTLDLRNVEEERRKVKWFNDQYEGPIVVPKQGAQPKVERSRLLDWWNRLEILWQDQNHQQQGREASGKAQHNYGRTGQAAPEVGGEVKRRRSDRKP